MRTHRTYWALAAALLASCASYGAPDEVVFGVAVYTQPKPGFDFGSLVPPAGKAKYYLDTRMTIVDGTKPASTDPMPDLVAQTIRTNMNALGWEEVPHTSEAAVDIAADIDAADVGLQMAVLKGTAAVYYPGYWCDYWYYYSCYYDYYYAGSYQFGSVILQMTDVTNFDPGTGGVPPAGQRLQPLWGNLVYGVSSGVTTDVPRVQEGLNRGFDQSPYLNVNP